MSLKSICNDVLASRSENINPWIDSNKPCCTVTKTMYKDLFKIKTGERTPTIKELKNICSFPDEFKLHGSISQQWARMGNAVMPKMMYHIAKNIKDNILNGL
jgi:DNA (cytosine-5)-methyltransferase 1